MALPGAKTPHSPGKSDVRKELSHIKINKKTEKQNHVMPMGNPQLAGQQLASLSAELPSLPGTRGLEPLTGRVVLKGNLVFTALAGSSKSSGCFSAVLFLESA